MSAESGQKFEHHLRSTTNSITSIAGIRISPIVASPWAKARQMTSTVANDRPTGHTRQNTGNPKTAVESKAPPSTAWRESTLPWCTGWHLPQAPQV